MQFLLIFWMVTAGAVIFAKSLYIFIKAIKTGDLDNDDLRALSILLLLSPIIPLALVIFVIGFIVSFFVKIKFFEDFKDAVKADLDIESENK